MGCRRSMGGHWICRNKQPQRCSMKQACSRHGCIDMAMHAVNVDMWLRQQAAVQQLGSRSRYLFRLPHVSWPYLVRTGPAGTSWGLWLLLRRCCSGRPSGWRLRGAQREDPAATCVQPPETCSWLLSQTVLVVPTAAFMLATLPVCLGHVTAAAFFNPCQRAFSSNTWCRPSSASCAQLPAGLLCCGVASQSADCPSVAAFNSSVFCLVVTPSCGTTSGVNYPKVYADGTDEVANQFNCTQVKDMVQQHPAAQHWQLGVCAAAPAGHHWQLGCLHVLARIRSSAAERR